MLRVLKRLGFGLLVLAATAYAAVAGYMAWNQREFIFRVDQTPPNLSGAGLPGARDISLAADENITLKGWQIAPTRADAPVFVYFPGNARTRAARSSRFRVLTETGAGLIAYDHRGYGGSGGAPSEELLHRDARAIYADAKSRFPHAPLIIFGESLGSGVASRLASEVQPAALILDSAFDSMSDIVRRRYPWLPVDLLLQHPFRSDRVIGEVRAPVLMLHGERDTVVPVESGRALYQRITAAREWKVYPGARHVGVFSYGAIDDIRRFLKATAGVVL